MDVPALFFITNRLNPKTMLLKHYHYGLTIVLAITAALATQASTKTEPRNLDINGLILKDGKCEETGVLCTSQGTAYCTGSGLWLYKMNSSGTYCPTHLFRKP
jgi:hypothetical protein